MSAGSVIVIRQDLLFSRRVLCKTLLSLYVRGLCQRLSLSVSFGLLCGIVGFLIKGLGVIGVHYLGDRLRLRSGLAHSGLSGSLGSLFSCDFFLICKKKLVSLLTLADNLLFVSLILVLVLCVALCVLGSLSILALSVSGFFVCRILGILSCLIICRPVRIVALIVVCVGIYGLGSGCGLFLLCRLLHGLVTVIESDESCGGCRSVIFLILSLLMNSCSRIVLSLVLLSLSLSLGVIGSYGCLLECGRIVSLIIVGIVIYGSGYRSLCFSLCFSLCLSESLILLSLLLIRSGYREERFLLRLLLCLCFLLLKLLILLACISLGREFLLCLGLCLRGSSLLGSIVRLGIAVNGSYYGSCYRLARFLSESLILLSLLLIRSGYREERFLLRLLLCLCFLLIYFLLFSGRIVSGRYFLCRLGSSLCRGSSLSGSDIGLSVAVNYCNGSVLSGLVALSVPVSGLSRLFLTVNNGKSLTLCTILILRVLLSVVSGGGDSLGSALLDRSCLNGSNIRLRVGMSDVLLGLLVARCKLSCSLCAVNNGKRLKLGVLILLILLFVVCIGRNVYLLHRNRRYLILINRVCLYVNAIGSKNAHAGLILGKEKHNLLRSLRVGKRSGALYVCRLSGRCILSHGRSSLCGSCIFSRSRSSLCGSCIFSLSRSSLSGRCIFGLSGSYRGSGILGGRCIFCTGRVCLCSLDHDCGSLATVLVIALSSLKGLESKLFLSRSLKKRGSLLDTGIDRLCVYGCRRGSGSRCGSALSRGAAGIVARGSLRYVNRLGGRGCGLITSSLSSPSFRLIVSEQNVSLRNTGIYPRVLLCRSGLCSARTGILVKRGVFGHGLRLSKIRELLICAHDCVFFIVSGNVRSGSGIIACA